MKPITNHEKNFSSKCFQHYKKLEENSQKTLDIKIITKKLTNDDFLSEKIN